MVESLTEEVQALSSEDGLPITVFSIDFFDRLENKTTKLINNEIGENFLKGRHSLYPFYFKDPTFVQRIEISVEGYSSTNKVEFFWQNSRNGANYQSSKQNINGNISSIEINEVIEAFAFQPPRKRLSKPTIKKVVVTGLSIGNFTDACEKIGQHEKFKKSIIDTCNEKIAEVTVKENELVQVEEQLESLNTQIDEKKASLTTVTTELTAQTNSKAEIDAALEESRSKETNLNLRIQSLEDTLDQKTNESSSLNTEIENRKTELKKLKTDIDQFPAEFSGFVAQGGTNITTYRRFSYAPIILILLITGFLFWGTADLSAKYEEMPTMNLYTMLASRLPFTFIATGIIIACYKLSKYLIEEIMRINKQRLDLTRVSIIANDISNTSLADLNLDDTEIFELRTKLKMDMIRSHLKTLVGDEYKYDIELSIWERFINWKKSPNLKVKADLESKELDLEITDAEET